MDRRNESKQSLFQNGAQNIYSQFFSHKPQQGVCVINITALKKGHLLQVMISIDIKGCDEKLGG